MDDRERDVTSRRAAARRHAVMAAALLALLGGAVGGAAGGGEAREGSPASRATAVTHTLAGGEVMLAHPAELALAVTADQLLAPGAARGCGEAFDYCFYLPEEAYAGSNLSAATLRVSARDDLRAEVSCLLAQPSGYTGLRPGVRRGEPVSTARFGDLSEGAAGSYTRGDVYRLWTGEACYEFEPFLRLTRFENYEPGAVTEFTEDDQAEVLALFERVLDSVTLVDGTRAEWPSAPRSTLEAFVRLTTPRPGASVTSPLAIHGDAVGPWFFEGSFPLELITSEGEVLASGYVIADGHWMTTGFVPFSGELAFAVEAPTEAFLLLRRDNPSDLPENDASARVPLLLLPD